MELPLAITRSGAQRVALAGLTNNISSSGVLFTAEREPDLGGPIEYIITLNNKAGQDIHLRCIGKVLRSERDRAVAAAESPGFRIAATLERYEFLRNR